MLYLTPKGDNSSTQYDVIFFVVISLRTTIREPFIGTNIHFPSRKPEGYYVLRHTVKTARRLTSTSFSHFSPGFYFSVHPFLGSLYSRLSSLLGKSKKVRVIGGSKQVTRNKKLGWGRNVIITHTSLLGQQGIYCHFQKGIQSHAHKRESLLCR